MSDLIKKLRMTIGQCDCPCQDAVIAKAAKELERLEDETAHYRKALQSISSTALSDWGGSCSDYADYFRKIAREALDSVSGTREPSPTETNDETT